MDATWMIILCNERECLEDVPYRRNVYNMCVCNEWLMYLPLTKL